MNGLFVDLEREEFFLEFTTNFYLLTNPLISDWFECNNKIEKERILYAFREYRQNVDKFSVLLHSKNPDQYKRAGALLHAVLQSEIIVSFDLVNGKFGSVDDLESGFTRVSYGDAQHVLKFVDFYREYHNQLYAFELAYRCCAAYTANPRRYDLDYLWNVCRYLKANNNLGVDSCFMLFKSLML